MRRRAIGYTAAGLLVLVTAACSAESSGSKSSSNGDAAGAAVARPQAAASGAGTAFGAAGGAPHAAAAAVSSVVTEAKIRTAFMTVDVRGAANVARKADEASRITTGAGGDVAGDERSSGATASATLQLRVPPDRLTGTLDELARLGTERRRALSVTDVSEKVADVDSRVLSARDAIARLRVLYSSATKIGEVITVEGELSRREADLESLQAQQRTLARETAMAVITLNLRTAPERRVAKSHKHKHDSGFVGGLHRGWDGFVHAADGVATAVGVLLPFLAVAVLLGLGARIAWRRFPRRPGPAPAPSPAE